LERRGELFRGNRFEHDTEEAILREKNVVAGSDAVGAIEEAKDLPLAPHGLARTGRNHEEEEARAVDGAFEGGGELAGAGVFGIEEDLGIVAERIAQSNAELVSELADARHYALVPGVAGPAVANKDVLFEHLWDSQWVSFGL